MELDDAFTKAALYETCVKSKVLRNIDLDKVDTQTLRGLVNKYNALSLREFPIIVSKVLIKFGMTFVTEKMPRLRSYINPNNISVQVEADELAYLERTQSNFQPNIYMIVAKNVAVGMLGTSIQSLHELITATVDTTKTTESDESAASRAQKIRVSSVQQTVPDIVTPKRFTRFADSFKSQAVGSPGRSVKQITTDLSRTYGSREKQRLATREERHNRRGAVLALQRGTATTDDDDDDEDGLSVVNDGREATAGEEDVEDDASTGDARSAEAFSNGANGFEEFEQSSRVASSREVEEAAKMELVGDTVTLAGDEDQNRGVGSSDALARVERFIEQSRPVANTIVSQPDSRMPTDVSDREVLKPLRSINADEFMTLVESNYTNLASDGVAVGNCSSIPKNGPFRVHCTVATYRKRNCSTTRKRMTDWSIRRRRPRARKDRARTVSDSHLRTTRTVMTRSLTTRTASSGTLARCRLRHCHGRSRKDRYTLTRPL